MREKKTGKRGKSIRTRLLAVLLVTLLLQAAIYLLVFLKGGIVSEAEENAFSIFREQTANRAIYLENDMVGRWSSTREGENDVYRAVEAVLASTGGAAEDLRTDMQMCQQVVSTAAQDVISMLRRNGVTGAFLVLDCPGEDGSYPGFYVRDYDPSGFSENNADLLIERGLPTVARETGVAMDSYWSAFFRLDDPEAVEDQFFFAPIRAASAVEPERRSAEYFYYWSGRFRLSGLDREVITYSVPLVWKDGTILGVLGVDLTCDHLADRLRYDELGDDRMGAYFLGVSVDGGAHYNTVCTSGPNFKAWFGQTDAITAAPSDYEGVVRLSGGGRALYGAVQPIKLYNVNTPFEGEQWALIGILDDTHLLGFAHHIQALVLLTSLGCLVLGAALMLLAARTMTRPLTNLVNSLERSDPDRPIRLPRLGMAEIDALTGAIEDLSNSAAESASRTSKIIAMTHIPIGVFEYQRDAGRVFCSRSLFTILDWDAGAEEDGYLSMVDFQSRLDALGRSLYDEESRIYRIPLSSGRDRWVQLSYRQEGDQVLGAFQDVTRDMEERRRMEYERDFDILTDLYNRRAFDARVRRLFESPEKLGVSALLMFDLDNLKYVNDTYGHDYGDRYIQAYAKSLEFFYRCRSVVGRRSGDEFNVFLYGYGSQAEVRACLDAFWKGAEEAALCLPTGERFKVRASGGLAWYPENAQNYDELLRRADFAMYNIKHTVKGRVQEFDPKDYAQKSILVQGQDALNRLIDGRLVRYALQPIVSAVDGGVYGYEMLMRPQLEQLADLNDLFLLAKAESKLLQIEELTWFEALATFDRLDREGEVDRGSRVFINSVGSQLLTAKDIEELEACYGHLLSRVVIEITEGEASSEEATSRKKRRAALWRAQVALDDFGTGFNSESALIRLTPDLVKVDMSIIRGIEADPDRRDMLRNLIGYARARNIRVLAEGVETFAELDTVIASGVDYIQGYYVARPAFQAAPIPEQVRRDIRALHEKYHPQGE